MTYIPKVSIIVPVYNTEKYLRSCLDSIMVQTFSDFEAILVDDGSTDNSGKICDEYAVKDPRFIVVHKQNEGVAKARITAYEHSKGEMITFMDSDDVITEDYIEKLSKPIIEENADMVSCDYIKVINGVRKSYKAKLTGSYDKEKIKDFIANHYFFDEQTNGFGMTCFLWSKMVRREFVLKGLEKCVGMWFGEDQVSMFTMLLQCNKLVLIPDRLYYYIQHKEQTIKRYDESLWRNITKLMSTYQSLIQDISCISGFRKRVWTYIEQTIICKMARANLKRSTFVKHLSTMRNDPFMKDFFKAYTIDSNSNWKSNVKYWVLKMKMYQIVFFLTHK